MSERRNLSVSADTARLLDGMCALEGGVSQGEVVRRALETRAGLLDLVCRYPRSDRGLTVRMCVLPEGVRAPAGVEVFRIYSPLPEQEGGL